MNYTSYCYHVADAVKTLSLEELRYFFTEDAPEDNGIPTLSMKNNVLHQNVVPWHFSETLNTWSMKIIDWFINNHHQLDKKTSTLQKIIKHLQLQEFYSRASVIFKSLIKDPPNASICLCSEMAKNDGTIREVLKHNYLNKKDQSKKILTNAFDWDTLKNDLENVTEDEKVKDLAIFLYCSLKPANANASKVDIFKYIPPQLPAK